MTGDYLKSKLRILEPKLTDVARKLGMSKQSLDARLSTPDIKTGFLEQLATIYECPISFFFGEQTKSDSNPELGDACLEDCRVELAKTKSELEHAQKRIDKLLIIIENLSKGNDE